MRRSIGEEGVKSYIVRHVDTGSDQKHARAELTTLGSPTRTISAGSLHKIRIRGLRTRVIPIYRSAGRRRGIADAYHARMTFIANRFAFAPGSRAVHVGNDMRGGEAEGQRTRGTTDIVT